MLSVVTITYNNFEELVKTVESVKDLPIEHIIVNGGSCVKTAEFLTRFSGISLSEKDKGISDAFNKGIRLSTGTGIMFLNSGDLLYDREYLSRAEKALSDHDFVYSDMIFDDSLAGKLVIKPHGQPLGRGMPFPHQTMVVKREAFGELGLFKLEYKRAMCFEFTCRLLKAKKKGYYDAKPTILMDGTGVSATQEVFTLAESKQAMLEHSLYDIQNRFYFGIRQAGFLFRKTLLALHLGPVLKQLKLLKRR